MGMHKNMHPVIRAGIVKRTPGDLKSRGESKGLCSHLSACTGICKQSAYPLMLSAGTYKNRVLRVRPECSPSQGLSDPALAARQVLVELPWDAAHPHVQRRGVCPWMSAKQRASDLNTETKHLMHL